MLLAPALLLLSTPTDLPFRDIGQVAETAVPYQAAANPDVYSLFAGYGAVSSSGKYATMNVAGVDYRRFFDVEVNLETGVQRELPGVGLCLRHGHKLLLTSAQARAVGAPALAPHYADTLPAPSTVLCLGSGKRLAVWTAPHWRNQPPDEPTFTERVISLVPSDEGNVAALPGMEELRTPSVALATAPWRQAVGDAIFETIEAVKSRGLFVLERARFDLRRSKVTRKVVARVPARRGSIHLQLVSCSIDGRRAVLVPIGLGRARVASHTMTTRPVYLWSGRCLAGPFAVGSVWIWRDRFLCYEEAASSMSAESSTVCEIGPAAPRRIAKGWLWLATSPDGSKVLASQGATDKPYLLTFR